MRQFRVHIPLLRPIAAVLLAVSVNACTQWSVVPEVKSLATTPQSTVRLTLVGDAKQMKVKHPTIVGDSLIWDKPERGSLPLSQIAWVESRSLDPIKTGFFALAGVTFVLVITLRQ